MRIAISLVSFALLVTLLHAGGDSKSDLKAMEGAWTATIAERDGKPASDKEKEVTFKLLIKDGKYTVFFNDKQLTKGALKLDPAKKEIDALQEEGPFKGMTQKGLYEVKGNEMRVIFAEPGKDRPADFKTRPKTGEVLLQYVRAKEAKKK